MHTYVQTALEGKRITAVVGHYGSGKTEFSVSLAFALSEQGSMPVSLIDLDIANPYFRSREQKEPLEKAGINVYGSAYGTEITAELPALDPAARAPLEDANKRAIVDVGGDNSGARILNQYGKYFTNGEHELLCVVNKNRPDTGTIEKAMAHINAIEKETSIKITGLISNAHFVSFTTAQDVIDGYYFTKELSEKSGIPVAAVCAPRKIVNEVEAIRVKENLDFEIMPVGLYMRPAYLDISL